MVLMTTVRFIVLDHNRTIQCKLRETGIYRSVKMVVLSSKMRATYLDRLELMVGMV